MNTQDEKNIRSLEAEVREIQLADKGRMGTFISKYGMQLLVQTLSIVIALTLGYAAVTNSIATINKEHIVLAKEFEEIKANGSVPTKILEEQFTRVRQDISEIKTSQLRFEDKLDYLSERNFTPVR